MQSFKVDVLKLLSKRYNGRHPAHMPTDNTLWHGRFSAGPKADDMGVHGTLDRYVKYQRNLVRNYHRYGAAGLSCVALATEK